MVSIVDSSIIIYKYDSFGFKILIYFIIHAQPRFVGCKLIIKDTCAKKFQIDSLKFKPRIKTNNEIFMEMSE